MERTTDKKETRPKKNLTKNETDTLKDLSSRRDIVIFKTDEGGAREIIEVNDYISEANKQLNNKESYKEIPNDLTKTNKKKVNEKFNLLKFARLFDEKKFKNQESKTPEF